MRIWGWRERLPEAERNSVSVSKSWRTSVALEATAQRQSCGQVLSGSVGLGGELGIYCEGGGLQLSRDMIRF